MNFVKKVLDSKNKVKTIKIHIKIIGQKFFSALGLSFLAESRSSSPMRFGKVKKSLGPRFSAEFRPSLLTRPAFHACFP